MNSGACQEHEKGANACLAPARRGRPKEMRKTKEPVRQGLVSMTGTFLDTIIVCTTIKHVNSKENFYPSQAHTERDDNGIYEENMGN